MGEQQRGRVSQREVPKRGTLLRLRYRWRAVGAVGAVGLALSVWGFWILSASTLPVNATGGQLLNSAFSAVYSAVIGFWFNAAATPAPWPLQFGRLMTMAAAIFVGSQFLLAVLRSERLQSRARRMKGHVIVCGAGELGAAALDAMTAQNERIVVVDQSENLATVALARRGGAVVVGDATDPYVLLEAGIDRARLMLVCCGDDDRNAAVADAARRLLGSIHTKRAGRPPTIRVHIDDPSLLRQMRPYALHLSHTGQGASDVDFFNIAEITSKHLMTQRQTPHTGASGDRYDTAIVGDTRLAKAIALAVARAAYAQSPHVKPRILLCGPRSSEMRQWLIGFVKGIESRAELVADSTDLDQVEPGSHKGLFSAGHPRFSEAYVCTDDDVNTVRVALALTAAVAEPPHPSNLRVWACIYGESGVASMVSSVQDELLEIEDATDSLKVSVQSLNELDTIEMLAQLVHAKYLECERAKPEAKRKTDSYKPWDRLASDYREANRDQVREFVTRLEEADMRLVPVVEWDVPPFGFSDMCIEELAQKEHERWSNQKLAQGWKPGPPNRRKERLHECLVPWEELSEFERQKDRKTLTDMGDVLAAAGMRPVKVSAYRGPAGRANRA